MDGAWDVADDRVAWLGGLLHQMSVGAAVLVGPDRVVDYVNPVAAALAGPDVRVGGSAQALVPAADPEAVAKAIAQVDATGQPASLSEVRIWVPDPFGPPQERFIDLTFQSLSGWEGDSAPVLVTMIDRTAAVEASRGSGAVLEREHRLAEALQRSLLPAEPQKVAGLAVAARYVPGGSGAAVGGDWYDVFSLPDGLIGVTVGDVVGRGVSAAVAMARCRSALRAFALDGASPVRVFECMNRLFERYGTQDMASVLYGIYDPATRIFRLVSAGQPPPLLIAGDGAVTHLDLYAAPPLGVAMFPYSETVVDLPAGSTLLLYSDGLIERGDGTLDEALSRLAAAIPTFAGDLDAVCDELLRNLDVDGAPDDVVLLALSPTPLPAEPLLLTLPAVASAVPALRRALSRWLLDAGATPDEVDDIVLAADEAATNVFQHAYPDRTGLFEVQGTLRDGEILLTVRDFGKWRPAGPGRQRGLGTVLMDGLMDEVEMTPRSDGTDVRLRSRLGSGRQAWPEASRSVSADGSVPVLHCSDDEIGAENAEGLAKLVLAAARDGLPGVVLDLSGVAHVDSSGLRLLFGVAQRLEGRGQHLALVVPSDGPLRRLLLLTDLPRVIPLARSVAEADVFLRAAPRD